MQSNFNDRLRAASLIRGRRAAELKAKGKTWAEVGAAMKITRQRAQQLAAKYYNQAHAETPAASAPSAP